MSNTSVGLITDDIGSSQSRLAVQATGHVTLIAPFITQGALERLAAEGLTQAQACFRQPNRLDVRPDQVFVSKVQARRRHGPGVVILVESGPTSSSKMDPPWVQGSCPGPG